MVKTTDSKGRITLGSKFANKTVLIEEIDDTEVRVTIAAVIPTRELWLHKNPKAKHLLEQGLAQSAAGIFSEFPPNLNR